MLIGFTGLIIGLAVGFTVGWALGLSAVDRPAKNDPILSGRSSLGVLAPDGKLKRL
jgi:hypothetical protein